MANKLLSQLLKGAYSAITAYTVGDIVTYNGSSYVCKANTTGNLPTNTTYWAMVAEKGATGETGEQGLQGEQGIQGEQGLPGSGDMILGTAQTVTAGKNFNTGTLGVNKTPTAGVAIEALNTSGGQGLRVENPAASDIGFSSFVTNDNQVRFRFLGDGNMAWGDGTNVADTNLYRSAANTLKSDDNFVANNIAAGATVSGANTGDEPASSLTTAGKVELATTTEINTGTDSTRAMPIDQFVASNRNVRYILFRVLDSATDWSADATTKVGGDLVIPFTGTIIDIEADVDTAGTTGTAIVDVNLGGTTIMSTNKLKWDSTEKSTRTYSGTAPGLTTTAVTAGDIITVDIDTNHTTKSKGLTLYLAIRLT